MASTTNNRQKQTTAQKKTVTRNVSKTVEAETSEEKQTYKVKNNLDPTMMITVKNGFNGTLIYKSRRTGERFEWDSFGAEQDMELSELKAARNSSKAFFINNWFLIDDPAVIEWLGMERYYKHALNSQTFDQLFKKDVSDIESTISGLSSGQKKSVAFRAKQLIDSGEIDSIRVITALEKSLNMELIERGAS